MFAVNDYVMFQGDPDCTGTITDVDGTRVFVVWDDGAENDWYDENQLDTPNPQTLWHIRSILTGDDSIYGVPDAS